MALLPMHMLGLGLFGQQGGIVAGPGNLGLQDPESTWQFQAPPWANQFGLGSMQGDMLGEGLYSDPSYTPVMPGEAGMGPQGGLGLQPLSGQSEAMMGDPNVSRGTKEQFDANPWQLALLAAGSELLKSSNWSRYPQALSAGLGAAGQAGIGTYMGAKRQQDQSALAREQIEAMRGTRTAQVEAAKAMTEQRRMNADIARQKQELAQQYFNQIQIANNPGLPQAEREAARGLAMAALQQRVLLDDKPEALLAKEKEQIHPFTKETGLDPNDAKNEQVYKNWLKKHTEFAPPANFNIMPENKAQTVLAGETAKNISAFQEQATNAMRGAADFQAITDILGDYEGGVIDEWKAALGQYIPTDELKNITSANQLANSIRLRASNAFRMPGSVSNYEAQTYISAVPGMIWYREGRELASSYARKLADRMASLTDFMQEEARSKGYVSQKALNEFDKSLGPVFTDEERAIIRKYQGKKPPAQQAAPEGVPPWQRAK